MGSPGGLSSLRRALSQYNGIPNRVSATLSSGPMKDTKPGKRKLCVSSSTTMFDQEPPFQYSQINAGPSVSPFSSTTSKNTPKRSTGSFLSKPKYKAGVTSSTVLKGRKVLPGHFASSVRSSY